MMRAYAESYLADAADALGEMLDYAVVDCGFDADEFFGWFIVSGVGTGFERGNPKFVAGMSGAELADAVRYRVTGKRCASMPAQPLDRGPEYWSGWALAQYQWHRAARFSDMLAAGLSPSAVMARYVLHEADVSKFIEYGDALMERACGGKTALAAMRQRRGLTQRELAEQAGVSLRMVQLYEQRRNDLSKAASIVALRLARVLGCDVADLVM